MSEQKIDSMRHSLSHILAQAVLKYYPEAKLTIGPAVDNGFYYDFDLGDKSFSDEDLKNFQKEMERIIKDKQKFEQFDLSIEEAKAKLANNPYKLELIEDLVKEGETKISFYRNVNDKGEVVFEDMCIGPHAENTREVGAFKLDKIAGAYWRGKEENKMLQRLYGLAFATKDELFQYVKMREEALKRDHRKVGKEMGLFVFSDLVGPGLPLYTFKGAIVRQLIIDYTNELQKGIGYQTVHTPNMNKAELFKVSGHYDKYKDDMFLVKSNYTDEEYYLKPMNCPQHTQIYGSELRSYKDLPLRIADFANLYRDEKPGELNGLSRLRCFCQDDAHCFCREDQIESEFLAILGIIKTALNTYGLKYRIRLSLWDENNQEKYLGSPEVWNKSQALLEKLLIDHKIEYEVGVGEAAIYGPKMDILAKDAMGREWQISTIQLDFIMPVRFKLSYIDSDGSEKTPIMIHRAIIGSPERFMGILIEHYAGNFPFWLAPEQVRIISVGEKHQSKVNEIADKMKANNIRVQVDISGETVGYKIRHAEKDKVPYMLVVGDKEMESGEVTVRVKGVEEQLTVAVEKLIEEMVSKNKNRD